MKKRNLFKKSLSVMLALLMVLSTLVIIPMASADEADELPEAWDGMTYDYSWYKVADAGTVDKPYEIATAAQLAAWSALSNGTYTPADLGEETAAPKVFNDKYFVLTADINMGSNPLTPIVAGFAENKNWNWFDELGSGLSFDGQGHTIYNLLVKSFAPARTHVVGEGDSAVTHTFGPSNGTALFAALGPDSTIKNLNFVGAESNCGESGWNCAGIVVAYASGDNMTFENIVIDETSIVKGYRICGSIVAYTLDRDATKVNPVTNIKNCAMFGKIVTTGARSGGILGCHITANTTYNVENCVFAGEIEFTSNTTGGVSTGGLFGCTMDVISTLNFTNCVNLGVFYSRAGETHDKNYEVAGIAATYDAKGIHNMVNCYDLGTYDFTVKEGKTIKLYGMAYDKSQTSTYNYCYSIPNAGLNYVGAGELVPSLDTTIEVAPFTYSTVAEEVLDIMAAFTGVNLKDAILDLIAWDGMTFDYSWYKVSGAGTAEKPYEIADAAQLAAWSALSNGTYDPAAIGETEAAAKVFNDKYFVLTADINMAGNPILPITAGKWSGNPQVWDKAAGSGLTFDGQGYTIYNMAINSKNSTHDGQALFGSIGPNTTIKNIKFVGANVGKGVGGWQPAGIVAAYATDDGLVMENIFIDSTSTIDANRIAGSLVAYMLDRPETAKAPANFKNCVSNATIKTDGLRAAGLLGCHISKNGVINFENCVYGGNYELKAGGITDATVAGIAGITMDVDSTLNFKNCVCTANFYTPEGVNFEQPATVAGISNTGNPGSGTQTQTFENCFDMSTKNVTSTKNVAYYVLTRSKYDFTATNSGGLANGVEHADTDYVIDALTPEIEAQIAALSNALMFEYVNFNGEGTEASPLVIATAEDLYNYAVNYKLFTEKTYITVTDDIEVGAYTFAPIAATVEVVVTADNKTITFPCTVADASKAMFAEGVTASVTGITPVIAAHTFEFACSTECAVCGTANTAAVAHTTTGACDRACNVCGAPTGATVEHTWDNGCDADCNVCGEGREVEGHDYEFACSETCKNCGSANPGATAHTYDNDCDPSCNVCNASRDADHTYSGECDTACDVCFEPRMDTPAHTYDNDQDTACNVCGATRRVTTPAPEPDDETEAAPEADETTSGEAETTKKPAATTEAPADEGCASSVAGIGALLALTASFGFAFVGKKKED